ncbi:N-acetylmuramoyl-L-alanine amidase [Paracoccus sp. IB05]|uniref:N-acetylmuramoyl-L-alanine amidase n=1 Tax=Paracoccus sp. IB05 TaxID=2779367 RepID=UPI0018E72EB6|nr:N-acetylmuramoyl-L-alanine amidase [Paracoccus sp. IB05]MBJ2150160.1 N-acetylmuramoyl-L-alanine amidase [Paracoccus sp. IB05]
MFTHGSAKTPVREAVLHCAAIKTGQFKGMRAFQVFATINQWHIKRGFKHGFGYHGLFMPDGDFAWGRPYSMVGAHTLGRNTGTLGFLMIESREITHIGEFSDWFTEDQREAVKYCLSKIPGLQKVSGHNDHAARLCPGFKVKSSDWL